MGISDDVNDIVDVGVDDGSGIDASAGPSNVNNSDNNEVSGVQRKYRALFRDLSELFEDRFEVGGRNVSVPVTQAKLKLNTPTPFLKIDPPPIYLV